MLASGISPEKARVGLVLLHGRGAGAADITQFGAAIAVPDVTCLAPEAPGLSWWPTSFLSPMEQMEPFVAAGLEQVDAAIATFEDAGLTRDRIAILGFSQGGCLALEYLARRGAGLGHGFALSAGLVGTSDANGEPGRALYGYGDKEFTYDADLAGTQKQVPLQTPLGDLVGREGAVFRDAAIDGDRGKVDPRVMEGLGATVTARVKPGQGHGIDEQDVVAIREALSAQA